MIDFDASKLEKAKQAAMLDPVRKSEIKQQLLAMMENEPVRLNAVHRLAGHKALSFLKYKQTIYAVVLIIVFLGAGSGTVFASNQSLPGDLLYPMKLNVTEKVHLMLAMSSEAKAEVQLELLDRRMEEGTQLAASGKLDAKTAAQLESLIAGYQAELGKLYERFPEDKKVEIATSISSRLDAVINVHAHVLAQFPDNEDNSGFRDSLRKQQGSNQEESDHLVKVSISEDKQQDQFKTAAQNKISSAEKVFVEAESYVQQLSERDVAVNVKALGNAQLGRAKNSLDLAREEYQNGKYPNAFADANQAIKFAQQARAVVRLGHSLKVDLDIAGDTVIDDGHEIGKDQNEDSAGQVRGESDDNSHKSEDRPKSNRGLKLDPGI